MNPTVAAHRHRVLAHVVAGDPDGAGARREQRGEHAQRRRLAGPVGAEDAEKPPRSRQKESPFSTSRRPNVLRRPSTSISSGRPPPSSPTGLQARRRPLGAAAAAFAAALLPAARRGHSDTTAPTQSRIEPIHTQRMSGKIDHAQGDRLGGRVERLVGDDEQVLERPPEDHRAHGGAAQLGRRRCAARACRAGRRPWRRRMCATLRTEPCGAGALRPSTCR